MGTEIERKYLVVGDDWRNLAVGRYYRQGYLTDDPGATVRVRIVGDPSAQDGHAYLTIKGAVQALARPEFEYEIPIEDAIEMFDLWCSAGAIEKYRYRIPIGDLIWEVDEFLGANRGLILAEVELASREQVVTPPVWVGQEVSGDVRYYNSYLAQHPYSTW